MFASATGGRARARRSVQTHTTKRGAASNDVCAWRRASLLFEGGSDLFHTHHIVALAGATVEEGHILPRDHIYAAHDEYPAAERGGRCTRAAARRRRRRARASPQRPSSGRGWGLCAQWGNHKTRERGGGGRRGGGGGGGEAEGEGDGGAAASRGGARARVVARARAASGHCAYMAVAASCMTDALFAAHMLIFSFVNSTHLPCRWACGPSPRPM